MNRERDPSVIQLVCASRVATDFGCRASFSWRSENTMNWPGGPAGGFRSDPVGYNSGVSVSSPSSYSRPQARALNPYTGKGRQFMTEWSRSPAGGCNSKNFGYKSGGSASRPPTHSRPRPLAAHGPPVGTLPTPRRNRPTPAPRRRLVANCKS